MDGLPLSKDSSCKKFRPILGKLVNSVNEPFVIAIYCGAKDPRDVDTFLGDLVVELDELARQGYDHNGVNVPVETNNFTLDAPARSLVKCCIGHGGYGACEKCCVVGEYSENRANYANVPADCQKRMDEDFNDRTHRFHHVGLSPLCLLNIGLVSSFRFDSLHLVYKGVFLRFLEATFTWEGEWNLEAGTIEDISVFLESLISTCPRDFNRKPRKIADYYKYKATELRRLLMYDGVVAFKDKLNHCIYKMFLLLHCGIYILASPYLLPNWVDQAEEILKTFVQYSAQIFGNHFVVYNVHSLTWLMSAVRTALLSHSVLSPMKTS